MWRRVLAVGICVFFISNIVSADIIRGINIDFVTIGNPGNAANTRGFGAVGYEYQIGKYEVTHGQWNAFTVTIGAPTGNDYDGQSPYDADQSGNPADAYGFDQSLVNNLPTNNLSWFEAAQFCNYLTSGDKSLGAYLFSGDNTNPGDFLNIDRDSAVSAYGIAYVIPTEDEWYKAAYYTGSGYSTYANGSDTIPPADNGWNYGGGLYGSYSWYVGTGTMEQNETFDMMENIIEWNETLVFDSSHIISSGAYESSGMVSGGSYNQSNALDDLSSSSSPSYYPQYYEGSVGFRVASVPEPATLLLLGLGGLVLRRER